MSDLTETQKRIHESARKYFLEHGFRTASLRKIVADAGYTLGAFYGYYHSKEELFHALVCDTVNGLSAILHSITERMDTFPANARAGHMTECYLSMLPGLVDYLIEHRSEMRLLITCAEGTRYEHFLTEIQSEILTYSITSIEQSGINVGNINPKTCRLLIHAYFGMLTEIVLSSADREEIISVMTDIQHIYQHGIRGVLTDSV